MRKSQPKYPICVDLFCVTKYYNFLCKSKNQWFLHHKPIRAEQNMCASIVWMCITQLCCNGVTNLWFYDYALIKLYTHYAYAINDNNKSLWFEWLIFTIYKIPFILRTCLHGHINNNYSGNSIRTMHLDFLLTANHTSHVICFIGIKLPLLFDSVLIVVNEGNGSGKKISIPLFRSSLIRNFFIFFMDASSLSWMVVLTVFWFH